MDSPQKKQIEQLYVEMYKVLLAYARNALHERSLAEEVVQDVFCIACAKSDYFLYSDNPRGWLMTTLKFVIKNTMRQRAQIGKLAPLSLDSSESALLAAYDVEDIDTLYENFAVREDFQLFKEIVLDKYTIREAAEEYGITTEACKKKVQRMRAFLRKNIS